MSERPTVVWVREAYRSHLKGREAWRPREVIGETSRSWVLAPKWQSLKVPKNGRHDRRRFAFSEREIDVVVWAEEHRYKIARLVERLPDAGLREVAKLLGYPVAE